MATGADRTGLMRAQKHDTWMKTPYPLCRLSKMVSAGSTQACESAADGKRHLTACIQMLYSVQDMEKVCMIDQQAEVPYTGMALTVASQKQQGLRRLKTAQTGLQFMMYKHLATTCCARQNNEMPDDYTCITTLLLSGRE